jgi:hypothetical protein
MPDRSRCRPLLTAGAILALGTGLLAPAAQADPNFPLAGGPGESAPDKRVEPDNRFEQAPEKAERLGGGMVERLLELGTDFETGTVRLGVEVIKCGLNIASPSVSCDL